MSGCEDLGWWDYQAEGVIRLVWIGGHHRFLNLIGLRERW